MYIVAGHSTDLGNRANKLGNTFRLGRYVMVLIEGIIKLGAADELF
jgi:hypothetical protein